MKTITNREKLHILEKICKYISDIPEVIKDELISRDIEEKSNYFQQNISAHLEDINDYIATLPIEHQETAKNFFDYGYDIGKADGQRRIYNSLIFKITD